MPLSIATNIASMTAQRSFLNSNADLETAFERLSTGKRINSSSDDAAGLAIGKGLESRVSGLNQAIRNVNDGISMVQIAEGTLDEVTTILQRMRDLAVQGANDSLGTIERGYLDAEHSKLADALGQALDQAKFNETDLIGDSLATTVSIQSGTDAGDTTSLAIEALSEASLNVAATNIDMSGATKAIFTVGETKMSDTATTQLAVTINGVTYTDSGGKTDLSTNALVQDRLVHDNMQAADGTKLSAVFTVTDPSTNLVFTAVNDGDQGATVVFSVADGVEANLTKGA
ncbi:hypothetical protein N9393_07360, partial [Luminiphilus sp.]|nr:hypothetical protein [Luminiphilus sp.]